ncbi:hypothetical protein ACQ4XT_02550 [Halobacillus faecis]
METNKKIFKGLQWLKNQQNLLRGDPSDVYSSLLVKMARVDTLPFILYETGSSSPFRTTADTEGGPFQTFCFRIENLDEQANSALVSLLHPLNVYGETALDLDELYLLKRTSLFSSLPINRFTAVRCLNIDLMKREVIIEPKW